MAGTYSEIPENYSEIDSFLETNIESMISIIILSKKMFFYDTCSFRRHSNLAQNEMRKLAEYFKSEDTAIVITRCILMELASVSGRMNEEYIEYLSELSNNGLKIILLDEESLFDILSECFSTNIKVNEYLCWAVRMSKSPVSTITQTLNDNKKLCEEVLGGKRLNQSDLYKRFFSEVRKNKEHSDNLGEELIGICVHILSHLPGIKDGKLCIITDDKGAAGNIDKLMRRTNAQFKGAKVVLFSTPKLVQCMYQNHIALTEDEMNEILSKGISGNLVIMGMTMYDLEVDKSISITSKELVKQIIEPNGIHIVF